MDTKKSNCVAIQEKIAWGKELSQEEKLHSISCASCGGLLLQFEEIDALVKSDEIIIPVDFSNSVMVKIEKHERKQVHIISKKVFEKVAGVFHLAIVRWGIGGASLLVAFTAH